MKKFIIAGMAVAMLAIPAAASANVAVENGVGYVGKGDVQNALGLKNERPLQDLFARVASSSRRARRPLATRLAGMRGGRAVADQPRHADDSLGTTPDTNNAGKVNGWNVNGGNWPSVAPHIAVSASALRTSDMRAGWLLGLPAERVQHGPTTPVA